MSLLEALQKRMTELVPTKTLVTRADGTQYVEEGAHQTQLKSTVSGFVVDSKPDKVPAKIAEFLYLGSQDAAEASVLDKYNIKHVLSVGITLSEPCTQRQIINKHIPCLDLPETSLHEVLNDACAFIDAAIKQNSNILVHCNAGVSRSPAVIIGYLIRRLGMTYQEARALVQHLRPSIRPNDGFIEQLQRI